MILNYQSRLYKTSQILNHQSRLNKAFLIIGQVIKTAPNSWIVCSDSRSAKNSGVMGWTVTEIFEGLIFECNCPDYQGQIKIQDKFISKWNRGIVPLNYPCKHILAVAIKEGYDYMSIIVNENKNLIDVMTYQQITTTTETPVILLGTAKNIRVYSFKASMQSEGSADVTIRDGIGGDIIDVFSLIARGDEKGFIGNHIEWIGTDDITVQLSEAQTVNIYSRSVLI